MSGEYEPQPYDGDPKDLFEASRTDKDWHPEPEFITPEQAAYQRALGDPEQSAKELESIRKWIEAGQVPFIERPDGSIVLPRDGAALTMAKLDGTVDFFTSFQPTDEELEEDAAWRPDWLDS